LKVKHGKGEPVPEFATEESTKELKAVYTPLTNVVSDTLKNLQKN